MLVEAATGQLTNISAGEVYDKDMKAAIVGEGVETLSRIRSIKLARDDHRIARCHFSFRAGKRRQKSDLLGVL